MVESFRFMSYLRSKFWLSGQALHKQQSCNTLSRSFIKHTHKNTLIHHRVCGSLIFDFDGALKGLRV